MVGTKYNAATAEEDDISNDITFKNFVKEYLTATSESTTSVDSADNGEWLKVIDNDNDGVADYVFRVDFTMTTIIDIDSKKGTYTFEDNSKTAIKASDIVTEDELVEGDVILYTYIDGVYYVSIPEIAVETIDKKGIDYKAETITCGDATYAWSGIDYDAYYYYHDVSEASTEVSYDLYLDHFGYVRLFTESAINKGFVLLLDGYYETDRRTDGYKAEIWNVEDEKSEDVIVLAGKGETAASTFIEKVIDSREEGTWKRLIEAGQVYFGDTVDSDPFKTNIAAYSVNEDGEYTLTEVQNASNKVNYGTAEIDAAAMKSVKDRTLININGKGVSIQTTTDTLYYYVSGKTVTTWVGYANAPKNATLGADARAYAVTTTGISTKYDVAEIVVIETSPKVTNTVNFVYALDQKLIGNEYLNIYALGLNDENEFGEVQRDGSLTNVGRVVGDTDWYEAKYYPDDISDLIKFYTIDSNRNVTLINKNYSGSNIYAGYVTVAERVSGRDYVEVQGTGHDDIVAYFYTGTIPSYVVTYSEKAAIARDSFLIDKYTVTREGNVRTTYGVVDNDEFSAGTAKTAGDRVIFFTDDKGNVEYIINVDESLYTKDKKDVVVGALADLWNAIDKDQKVTPVDPVQDAIDLAEAALAADPKVENDLTAAYDALNALDPDDLTGTEALYVEKLMNQITEELAKIEAAKDAQALKDAKDAAKKALDDFVDIYAGEDADIVKAASAVSDAIDWIKMVIDNQTTPEAAAAIFSYDADREGEKYQGANYDKSDKAWTGAGNSGNLKQDIMSKIDAAASTVSGVESARTSAVSRIATEELAKYATGDYTDVEYARLTAIVDEYTSKINAATTNSDVTALRQPGCKALAAEAVQIIIDRIDSTTFTASAKNIGNDNAIKTYKLDPLATDDVTITLTLVESFSNKATYTVTVTSAIWDSESDSTTITVTVAP